MAAQFCAQCGKPLAGRPAGARLCGDCAAPGRAGAAADAAGQAQLRELQARITQLESLVGRPGSLTEPALRAQFRMTKGLVSWLVLGAAIVVAGSILRSYLLVVGGILLLASVLCVRLMTLARTLDPPELDREEAAPATALEQELESLRREYARAAGKRR